MTPLLLSLAALASGTGTSEVPPRPSTSAFQLLLAEDLQPGGEADIFQRAFGRLRFDLGGGLMLDPRCLRFTPTDADGQARPLELRLDWRLDGAWATIRLEL